MRGLIVLLLIGLTYAGADASWVQYDTATGHVTGGPAATAEALGTVPGRGVIEDSSLDLNPPNWPIPAGCTHGEQFWTALSSGNVLPLIVRPALAGLFFTTTSPLLPDCHQVNSKRETRTLVESTLVMSSLEQDLVQAMAGMTTWFMSKCINVDGQGDLAWSGAANCVTWKSKMDTIWAELPGTGQGVTSSTDAATLILDSKAFIAAQCAASPGGPFC